MQDLVTENYKTMLREIKCQLLSHVRLFATPWTIACQDPLSMGVLQARKLKWVAIPFFRDLPNPGIKPGSPTSQADSLLSEPPGKPQEIKDLNKQRHISCLWIRRLDIVNVSIISKLIQTLNAIFVKLTRKGPRRIVKNNLEKKEQGLSWWSSGSDSELPVQRVQV